MPLRPGPLLHAYAIPIGPCGLAVQMPVLIVAYGLRLARQNAFGQQSAFHQQNSKNDSPANDFPPANRRPAGKCVPQTPLVTVVGCQQENKQALTALNINVSTLDAISVEHDVQSHCLKDP